MQCFVMLYHLYKYNFISHPFFITNEIFYKRCSVYIVTIMICVQASSFLLTNLIPEGFQSWYHSTFEIFFIQTELFSKKKCCVVCSR